MYYLKSSVFVTGVARIGKTDAIDVIYGASSLDLIIDTHSDTIISLGCDMVMAEAIEFVHQLLIGKSIVTDMDEMIETIQKRFLALSQKVLIITLRDAQNRCQMSVKEP